MRVGRLRTDPQLTEFAHGQCDCTTQSERLPRTRFLEGLRYLERGFEGSG